MEPGGEGVLLGLGEQGEGLHAPGTSPRTGGLGAQCRRLWLQTQLVGSEKESRG